VFPAAGLLLSGTADAGRKEGGGLLDSTGDRDRR
jgi:hypothetical protein